VLFFAARVGKAQVNELDAFFFDQLENISGRHEISSVLAVVSFVVAAGAISRNARQLPFNESSKVHLVCHGLGAAKCLFLLITTIPAAFRRLHDGASSRLVCAEIVL
jgi:hypothetical protein